MEKIESKGHIVICGYNSNIERVIKSIINANPELTEIILLNSKPETEIVDLIKKFPEIRIRFVSGDYTSEAALNRASITKAFSAIILADPGPDGTKKPDDRTLLASLAINSIAKDTPVSAELLESTNEVHLKRAGVDNIVLSGDFTGFLLASSVVSPGVPSILRQIAALDDGSNIKRIRIPQEFIGKTFKSVAAAFFDSYGDILIGVISERKSFNLETILSGEKDAIDKFIRRKFEEAGRDLKVEAKGRTSVNLNPGANYIIAESDYAVILTSKGESV